MRLHTPIVLNEFALLLEHGVEFKQNVLLLIVVLLPRMFPLLTAIMFAQEHAWTTAAIFAATQDTNFPKTTQIPESANPMAVGLENNPQTFDAKKSRALQWIQSRMAG